MNEAEFIDSFRHDQKKGHWWYDFNPLCKLITVLCLGFTSMIVFRWQVGLPIFVLATLIAATTPAFKTYLKTIGIMFALSCILTIGVRLYVHMGDPGPVAFHMFGKPVPVSAVISCLDMTFMIEGFLGIFMAFFLTTEMRDLCCDLERLGMSPTASFMVLSTFACIGSIKEKLGTVRESQRARGIETEGGFAVKVKSVLPVLFPVIISSMTGIEDKTLAMNARAFAARGKHTSMRKIAPASGMEKAVTIAVFLLCIAICVLGKLYL
ncbi:MAG: energy-coupling factor transporter transmembrane protein EcfT [Lachnospiraceae bacterium]|nr:energy-coupling factor transporter transmembrane protein EcfT [Lachnospiraceae bacterium]